MIASQSKAAWCGKLGKVKYTMKHIIEIIFWLIMAATLAVYSVLFIVTLGDVINSALCLIVSYGCIIAAYRRSIFI
ncbi:hypothetical protein [Limnobacter sp.]|uniref:hypothetical protein n=1 Tax=Limnobacter sp. TaxID=2003368 RepID=UPI0025C02BCB|nr:hypothetical protein [Limnobacter sp.]